MTLRRGYRWLRVRGPRPAVCGRELGSGMIPSSGLSSAVAQSRCGFRTSAMHCLRNGTNHVSEAKAAEAEGEDVSAASSLSSFFGADQETMSMLYDRLRGKALEHAGRDVPMWNRLTERVDKSLPETPPSVTPPVSSVERRESSRLAARKLLRLLVESNHDTNSLSVLYTRFLSQMADLQPYKNDNPKVTLTEAREEEMDARIKRCADEADVVIHSLLDTALQAVGFSCAETGAEDVPFPPLFVAATLSRCVYNIVLQRGGMKAVDTEGVPKGGSNTKTEGDALVFSAPLGWYRRAGQCLETLGQIITHSSSGLPCDESWWSQQDREKVMGRELKWVMICQQPFHLYLDGIQRMKESELEGSWGVIDSTLLQLETAMRHGVASCLHSSTLASHSGERASNWNDKEETSWMAVDKPIPIHRSRAPLVRRERQTSGLTSRARDDYTRRHPLLLAQLMYLTHCCRRTLEIADGGGEKLLSLAIKMEKMLVRLTLPDGKNNQAPNRVQMLLHRTAHTSLNVRLAHLSECQRGKISTTHTQLWFPQRQGEAEVVGEKGETRTRTSTVILFWNYTLSCLIRLLDDVVTMCLTRGGASCATASCSSSWRRGLARLTRLCCNVEVELSFQLYHTLGLAPVTSVDALQVFIKADEFQQTKSPRTSPYQTSLLPLLLRCVELRSACCALAHDAVVFWTATGLSAASSFPSSSHSFPRGLERARELVWEEYLSKFHNTFNAMLRRHFLFYAQEVQALYPCGNAVRNAFHKASESLCRHWLRVFLRWRDAAGGRTEVEKDGKPTIKRPDKKAVQHPGDKTSYFTACGVSLSQAMEVSFLMVACVQRWPQLLLPTGSEGGLPKEAESYIQEVFLTLEHSTAKQLWHLRSKGVMFYFTGEDRGHAYLRDANLRQRQAQSILCVVFAHVRHPSLLWMPLSQLQEMISILACFPSIIFCQEGEKSDTLMDEVTGQWMEQTGSGGAMDRHAITTPLRRYVRRKVVVGDLQTDFSLLHGYLMRRLFVISNVLREWRRRWMTALPAKKMARTRKGGGGALPAVSYTPEEEEQIMSALKRLESLEPEGERQRGRRREWATETVQDICSGDGGCLYCMGAEMEGVRETVWGAIKSFRRLERTIQMAAECQLLFTVVRQKEYTDSSQSGFRSKGSLLPSVQPEPVTAEGLSSSSMILQLHREHPDQSWGFTLRGNDATVVGVDAEEEEGEGEVSPFARAAALCGVDRPDELIGFRVVAVDDTTVRDAMSVAAAVKGKETFRLRITSD